MCGVGENVEARNQFRAQSKQSKSDWFLKKSVMSEADVRTGRETLGSLVGEEGERGSSDGEAA